MTYGTECARTCTTLHLPCLGSVTTAGCRCKFPLVWDDSIKRCIHESECPCHHHGRSYQPGSKIQWGCNQCICNNTKWHCTKSECAGWCSAYGDPHYTSFDGKKFMFQGSCEYVMAQDFCNGRNGTFRVQTQNVVCGSTGVTCAKDITVQVGDTVLRMERGKEITAKPEVGALTMTAKYDIVSSGIYTILVTDIGLSVIWDGGTTVYVSLSPTYKGKTCGLCGNFNGDRADDFQTPENDVSVLATSFGDSWSTQQNCPNAQDPPNACVFHKDRAPWAHKQCNILNKEPFIQCHEAVNPKPYFDACFLDTCSCDLGGDCECLCTAVSAYASECSKQGVHIRWRSKDFCPMQCDYGSQYVACGPSYARTCDNLCKPTPQMPLTCTEGCHCPNGTVNYQGNCVNPNQCPCIQDGVAHPPGSLVIRNCQQCTCISGCLVCSGPTCRPSLQTTIVTSTVSQSTSTIHTKAKSIFEQSTNLPSSSVSSTTLIPYTEGTTQSIGTFPFPATQMSTTTEAIQATSNATGAGKSV
ncbi:mucin-2-like [Rhopilema esculentum]|uniref:mucin-2-like n=1 Tax=Rhopilema esculentum TaxID=499914 RepID=UPI0031D1BE75